MKKNESQCIRYPDALSEVHCLQLGCNDASLIEQNLGEHSNNAEIGIEDQSTFCTILASKRSQSQRNVVGALNVFVITHSIGDNKEGFSFSTI